MEEGPSEEQHQPQQQQQQQQRVVQLRVQNVPASFFAGLRASVNELVEEEWGADPSTASGGPPVSGTLELLACPRGTPVWVESGPATAVARMPWQDECPPLYERATGELLAPPAQDRGLLLPGGAAAAERRRGTAEELGQPGGPTVARRPRVSLAACFNCGRHGHSVGTCGTPMSHERIRAARSGHREQWDPSSVAIMQRLRRRYFEGVPASDADRLAKLRPGVISPALREALGMASESLPPPWLSRMVALGVPPSYAAAAAAADGTEDGQQDHEQLPRLLVFHGTASDDDDEAPESSSSDPDAGQQQAAAVELAGAGDGAQGAAGGGDAKPPQQQRTQQQSHARGLPGCLAAADEAWTPAATAAAADPEWQALHHRGLALRLQLQRDGLQQA